MTDTAERLAAHAEEIRALIDAATRQPDPLGAQARALRDRLDAPAGTLSQHPETQSPRLPGDTFFTDDGYSLLWTDWDQWADHKDADKADMTFDAGPDGWPTGPDGPLAGTLFTADGGHERRDWPSP